MSDRLPLQELESYLWGAAIILRGLVEAGDYKQYVFPLLFPSVSIISETLSTEKLVCKRGRKETHR